MNYDNILREALIEQHSKEHIFDKYGQVLRVDMQIGRIIKDKTLIPDITQFIEQGKSKLVSLSTYGGSFGTYRALNIKCKILGGELSEAIRRNPNYSQALNWW